MKSKSSFKMLLVFLLLNSIIFSYEYGPIEGYRTFNIAKIIYPSPPCGTGGSSYSGGDQFDYGYSAVTCTSAAVIYRSVWDINLPANLPQGAFIYRVEFSYHNFLGSTSTFNLYNINISSFNNNSTNPQKWDITDNATFLKSLGWSGTTITVEVPDLADIINNKLSQSLFKLYLGFRAGTETGSSNVSTSDFGYIQIKMYYTIKVRHTIKNYPDGGVVKITINNQAPQEPTSGYILKETENTPIVLEAKDQPYGGYQMLWNQNVAPQNPSNWTKKIGQNGTPSPISNNRSYSYTTNKNEIDATYTAELKKKQYSVNFQTEKGNTINVNSTYYTYPFPNFPVIEQNKIYLSAPEVIENNIRFFVDHFDYGTYNSTSGNWEWTPTNTNQTNVARYKGMPQPYDRNLHFNTYNLRYPETNLTLYWNQYLNSSVGYQVWREVYNLNWVLQEGPSLLTTITNNSTTTFVDGNYWVRNGSNQTVNLLYDVRPVYIPSGLTAGSESWVNACGESSAQQKSITNADDEIISDYSLSNYPNPFNPTTRIEYQLPKAGFVTVKVYNALGKEVATLVNDRKDEGKYFVEFNGTELSSGIYFCELRANEFVSMKKMLLVK